MHTVTQDTVEPTSVMSCSGAMEFNASPVTTVSLTYEVDNMDLFDKYRTTRDWSILFLVRHVFDFGTPGKWGKLKVLVFEDLNANGEKDEGEIGLRDVLAYVVNGRGKKTDSTGIALIEEVVPGDRKVRLDMRGLPVDMIIKGELAKDVTVKPYKTSDVVFVIVTAGMIKGRVYVDMNDNGVYDKGIDGPVPNARVFVSPEYKDTLSFSDGTYRFEYVHPGPYAVTVDLKTVPKEYKLKSGITEDIEVESEETVEGVDFIFESRPIKVKYF